MKDYGFEFEVEDPVAVDAAGSSYTGNDELSSRQKVGWVLVGLFMSVLGFVPAALMFGGEARRQSFIRVAVGVAIGIVTGVSILLIASGIMSMQIAQELVSSETFPVSR